MNVRLSTFFGRRVEAKGTFMAFKITVDTGGTFTDVVVSDGDGRFAIGKAPTAERAYEGVGPALEVAAAELGLTAAELLPQTNVFVYSTTRATNAILTGRTAKTALLVTEGFPDVLTLREGGKPDAFDFTLRYPKPYIPKRLTFEVPERIDAQGDVVRPIDDAAVRTALERIGALDVEAVAVCLLWSVANEAHERRVGELIAEVLPGMPYTLSHEVNPIVREFRRASSAALDASLKPLMGAHLQEVARDLRGAGFAGELMVATSFGGVLHLEDVASRPIHTLRSGPSMAPVAGRVFARAMEDERDVIVCDTGGTSFDVSLIRDGAITTTPETWLGPRFMGHLTGMPSVDIRSIGSGGGSIAWVDPGGLVRVGPQSAGAEPGPASYGRGGTLPTVTDAAVVLGYIDPEGFLGGRMKLDAQAAHDAFAPLAAALDRSVEEAAASVLTVANEHMVGAIQDMTVNEGVDPRDALVVAGGGAAGLGIVPIVRELGCRDALVPHAAGALSATGGQHSDILVEFPASFFADTEHWDADGVRATLDELGARAAAFADELRERGITDTRVEYAVEARYAYQVWQLEVDIPDPNLERPGALDELHAAFDTTHERIFAVSEPGARLECLTWKARLRAPVRGAVTAARLATAATASDPEPRTRRPVFFDGTTHDTPIYLGSAMQPGAALEGPAIIEEPTSTLVVPPGCSVTVTATSDYYLEV